MVSALDDMYNSNAELARLGLVSATDEIALESVFFAALQVAYGGFGAAKRVAVWLVDHPGRSVMDADIALFA